MVTSLTDEFQKDFDTVRNKQVEIFDRPTPLESQMRQITENVRKLEHTVKKLDNNSPRRNPYQR